jgi:hypothetical protein
MCALVDFSDFLYSTSNDEEFEFHFDTMKHIPVVDESLERNRQKRKKRLEGSFI